MLSIRQSGFVECFLVALIAFAVTGCGGNQASTNAPPSVSASSVQATITPTPAPTPTNPAASPTAISGSYTLYRQLTTCASTLSRGCSANPMDVSIACAGSACTIIRTNSSSGGEPPWNHTIPLSYSGTAWSAQGHEQNAAECNGQPVPTATVQLTLEVISGVVVNGMWKAQRLVGTYTVEQGPTKCDDYGSGKGVYVLSTTPGLVPYRYKNPKSLTVAQLKADLSYFKVAVQDFVDTANLNSAQRQDLSGLATDLTGCEANPDPLEPACATYLIDVLLFLQPQSAS